MTREEIINSKISSATGFDKLTAAEHLEAAAKLLRQGAQQDQLQSVNEAFAELKNKKVRSLQKYGEGIRKMKLQQIEQAFAGSDWVFLKEHNGVKTYCRKGKGHLYINIKGDEYSVTAGEKTGSYGSVQSLGAFIANEKKKRG